MKNGQVIDGAINCTYPIYQFTDLEFQAIFPTAGQDVEFIEDVVARIGDDAVGQLLAPVWARELQKPNVDGIHGTLFYELEKKTMVPEQKGSWSNYNPVHKYEVDH